MKKKILALILSIGLLLSCLPVSTVAADSATVVAEGYTTTQGNYAYIYLRADNFVNIGVLDIELYYDSSVMSIHYTSNDSFLNSASVSTNTSTPGVIKISAMALNGLNSTTSDYSNRMMLICFKINSDCPVGEYPIAVTVGDAYDGDFNPANITGTKGVIKVEKASVKSFYFSTNLSSYTVKEADEFTLKAYSYNYDPFASADFTIEYDRDLLSLKSIELDPKLFVEGAIYSINTDNPGFAKISYASTNAVSCYNLFKITFEVIADTKANTTISITASDVYDNALTAYKPTTTTSTVSIKEKEVVPDYPDFKLESAKFIVGEASDIDVILEGNSKVAAADFVINYDKDVFTINSVSAVSETLSKGAMIVVNQNFSEGQIRFSYIKQNGDFTEDTPLVKISATPLKSPDEHYTMTSSGIDVCDISFNDVTLDYITDSDCIFAPTVIAPTCTEDGYTSYNCSCGEAYTDNITPSLGGHKYGDFIIDLEPTCTEEGSKSRHCSVCDDKTDVTVIDANGHSYGDWVVDFEPTCTEDGSKHKTCSVCGDVVTESINENGHSYSEEWTIDLAPTCTEEGSKSHHCTVCDDKTDVTVIDANGHSYGDWVVDLEPTCTENGSKHKTCSVCGDVVTESINENGHSYSEEWTIDLAPTCTEEGSKSHHCTVCDDKTDVTAIAPTGHSYSDEWTIDLEPTCTEEGSKSHHCTVCDNKTDVTAIAPTGHSYGDWVVDLEPTCTQSGAAHKTCTACGNIRNAATEILLDSQTYPESQHNYANNINETYTFSYPGAVSLELTFSTYTDFESKYDFLYIYDYEGNLYGKYSGSSLFGSTITLPGDSFTLNLVTDDSVNRYGFSFSSIVAFLEDDVIKPKGHSFELTSVEDAHPHIATYTCTVCGETKTEDASVNDECIECMLIVGVDDTYIDYDNKLIFTTTQNSSNINEIISTAQSVDLTLVASQSYGGYEFLGTGTTVDVYNNGTYVDTYTIILEGDVNGDSVCDVVDCTLVSQVTNGNRTFGEFSTLAADLHEDAVIDMNDYQSIVNKALAF